MPPYIWHKEFSEPGSQLGGLRAKLNRRFCPSHQLLSRPGAHYHRAPFVKLFPSLAAGGLLLAVCACTVAPSPTEPTALGTVDASASVRFEPAFYRAFVQNAFETPERL